MFVCVSFFLSFYLSFSILYLFHFPATPPRFSDQILPLPRSGASRFFKIWTPGYHKMLQDAVCVMFDMLVNVLQSVVLQQKCSTEPCSLCSVSVVQRSFLPQKRYRGQCLPWLVYVIGPKLLLIKRYRVQYVWWLLCCPAHSSATKALHRAVGAKAISVLMPTFH